MQANHFAPNPLGAAERYMILMSGSEANAKWSKDKIESVQFSKSTDNKIIFKKKYIYR